MGAAVYCVITLRAVGAEFVVLVPFFFLVSEPAGRFVDFGTMQGVCQG
jgi:hypothetical protein